MPRADPSVVCRETVEAAFLRASRSEEVRLFLCNLSIMSWVEGGGEGEIG